VTVEQVQHRLRCSKRTVFRLIGGPNPELPSIKVGRQRLIVAADVDAYIDRLRSTTRATPEQPVTDDRGGAPTPEGYPP
jgi:excisionase family DNA binding protein